MIEYIINTGALFDSSLYNNFGSIGGGIGNLQTNDPVTTDVTINGQTILETRPQVSVIAQTEIIVNSGEFFLSGFAMRDTTGFANFNFDSPNLKYDLINSGEHIFYRHHTHTGMVVGFSGALGSSLAGDYVFLNGVKLVSGESYSEVSNRFKWIDTDTGVTGLLFAMPKRLHNYYSGKYDLKGNPLNAKTSIGWLNGVKLDEEDILETSSFINTINTGVSCSKYFTGQSTDVIIF